jgi:hypothetical protein
MPNHHDKQLSQVNGLRLSNFGRVGVTTLENIKPSDAMPKISMIIFILYLFFDFFDYP